MAAIVVPSACRSRPRTFSCFDSGLDVIDFFLAPGLGCTLLMEAAFDFRFVTILVLLPWDCDGTSCRHHHNPAEAEWRWRGKEQVSENQASPGWLILTVFKSALTS
jgi:hypothetical protein